MASLLYWVGGTGRMGKAANWSGPGVGPDGQRPAAGDQLIIGGGNAFAAGPTWSGVNVTLNGGGTLTLQNGIVGALTVNARQYSAFVSAYGHMEIQGRSAVASGIQIGAAGQAPMTLDMNIADYSAFVNIAPLVVQNNSSFSTTRDTAPGFHGASFENHSSVVVSGGAHAVFGTKITASGTMRVAALPPTAGPVSPTSTDGGHIEFKGGVAAGQTVAITQGTVQVDQPMLFEGAVTLGAAPAVGAGTLAGASMSLMGLHAATAELTAGTLFLRGAAGNLLADIRVAAPAGGAVFVANQADSVSLTGYALPGASEVHSTTPVLLA